MLFIRFSFLFPYRIVFPAGALGYVAICFPVGVSFWLIIIIIIIIIKDRTYTQTHTYLSYIYWKLDIQVEGFFACSMSMCTHLITIIIIIIIIIKGGVGGREAASK